MRDECPAIASIRSQYAFTLLWLCGTEQSMGEQLQQGISPDPKIMLVKPVIRGTRIPVELIVRMLAQGLPEGDILREYPCLQANDIRAALTYRPPASYHE